MAKDDASGGLLSRVVKFVRHPATSWSDLDSSAADQDSEYSRAALKEMVKRKRRNDFVRKREFDMLRGILRRGGSTDDVQEGVRPSFFQSSLPSKTDDRAMTLKKIDEIEAQMSMQWWKTKGPDSVPSTGAGLHTGAASSSRMRLERQEAARKAAAAQAEADRLRGQFTETEAAPLTEDPATTPDPDRHLIPTLREPVLRPLPPSPPPRPAPAADPVRAPAPMAPRPAPPSARRSPPRPSPALVPGSSPMTTVRTGLMAPQPQAADGRGTTVFSASHFYALDVQEIAQDPEVEEAAIRFANGDTAGAEQCLLEALATHAAGPQALDDWLALFDFYRATGQQAPFESRAVDFASLFGRSAPQWDDMPGAVSALPGKESPSPNGSARAVWQGEPELDAHAVGTLQNVLQRCGQPWVLDWSLVEAIDVKAARALLGMFTLWADQDLDLRFLGADPLRALLQRLTPSGRRDIEQLWWELRMATLRLMNQPEEFELTALDFCVTYEVSPPGWEPPRCHFLALGASGTAAEDDGSVLGDVLLEQVPSTFLGDTGADALGSEINQLGLVELSGEIRGDPQTTLEALEQRLQGADVWIISCRHLIRADFQAAGALLNWVNGQRSQGRTVQFVDVHRLVSAFFHVIGITEGAKVVLRND